MNNKKKDLNLDEKWGIHQLIQEAIKTAHTSPSPETIRLLTIITERLEENTKILATLVKKLKQ